MLKRPSVFAPYMIVKKCFLKINVHNIPGVLGNYWRQNRVWQLVRQHRGW